MLILFSGYKFQTLGGNGGIGIVVDYSGAPLVYGSGGGGAGGGGGVGGSGAGNGAGEFAPATAGLSNRGGGGGGGNFSGTIIPPAVGGSGVVIIRYLGPPRGEGGIVTSNATHTMHVFNNSGPFVP